MQKAVDDFYTSQGYPDEGFPLPAASIASITSPTGSRARTPARQNSNQSARGSFKKGGKSGSHNRRALGPEERREVSKNREGNVCEKHKAQKMKCNPHKCKYNGQYNALLAASREIAHAQSADAAHTGNSPMSLRTIGPAHQLYNQTPPVVSNPSINHALQYSNLLVNPVPIINLAQQPSFTASAGPMEHISPGGSVPFLSNTNGMFLAPQAPGMAVDYFSGLPIPPTVPSNAYVPSQAQQCYEDNNGNTNNGSVIFEDWVNFDQHAQAGARDQDMNASPTPEMPVVKFSKSGPLVMLKIAFNRLFKVTSQQKY
ncbi:hypothetical protein CC86DRAFT_382301 [Ophiobolus disseminans]|uniref:Uncharacterized protein n=1 Tax=Ophiobolus disseminans TaxID=1469910 RepID=A0A6A7A0D7_9PLEO|nr:hypothetical protein CC86DRAFT_382301 [Ophiobolus disseminans]